MPTLEFLKQKIDTAGDLRSVVSTMKTLAAVSIHQYERAADALVEYSRNIELGLQIVLQDQKWRDLSAGDSSHTHAPSMSHDPYHGVIVFGSDQGMCGQFNEQIAAFAIEQHASHQQQPPAALWGVGQRVAPPLIDAQWSIDETFRLPTSVLEIADGVSELLTSIEKLRRSRSFTTLRIYSNVRSAASSYQAHQRQLLPINPDWLSDLRERKWESRSLPIYGGDRAELTSLLIRQSLYVSLYQACAESLASENASRIAAMQAAEKNIDETLEDLNTAFKTQRQTAITEELLDVVIGYEALINS